MSHPENAPQKPWYKHFWAWFVIGLPLCSVVMGTSMLIIANKNKVSMVKSDWYKDGIAINERIDKQQRAKALGITAAIQFDQSKHTVEVELSHQSPAETADQTLPTALVFSMEHPTLETQDVLLELNRTPQGRYWSKIPERSNTGYSGSYYIKVMDKQEEWQLSGKLIIDGNPVNAVLGATQ